MRIEIEKLVEKSSELMDKHFPKGECKERGEALVFNAEMITYIDQLLNTQPQTEEISNPEYDGIREVEKQKFQNIVDTVNKRYPQDTPEQWICPKCGFDDCYPYKNSEDFGLDYCPICSELVKLTTK